MALVLSIVWIAIQVISKTKPEQHRAKNVLKIPIPTTVGCRLVIFVVLVKKVILVVPNASVATRVKPERALVVLVKNVPLVNLVNPMIQTLLRARHATRAVIKMNWAKLPVCRAFPERIKMTLVQQNVKNATLGNTKIDPVMTPVWIAQWANT